MFLGTSRFVGDPADLVPAYDRLREQFDVESFDLHACGVDARGITIVHACPSESIFVAFETSMDWREFGLPTPVVEHLGDVHEAHLGRTVRR